MPQPFIRSRKRGVGTDFQPPPGGETKLRVGFFAMATHVGEGPGGGTTNPYGVAHWNPHAEGLADVPAVIALADQKDIILLSTVAGSPNNYGGAEHIFDINRYKTQLDKLVAIPSYNDAASRGRIQTFAADEPNHPDVWNGTFTPTKLVDAVAECKSRWPTALAHVRVTPATLRAGWGGSPGLASYGKLDYGWLQYAASQRKSGKTFAEAIAEQKLAAATLDIGLTLGCNLANSGIRTDLDGVTACWDYDLSGATPIGVVVGQPASTPFTVGQGVACTSLPPTSQNLLANPNWIKRLAAVAALDADAPFFIFWTMGSSFLDNWINRSDYVSAFTDSITSGNGRLLFNGLRVPK